MNTKRRASRRRVKRTSKSRRTAIDDGDDDYSTMNGSSSSNSNATTPKTMTDFFAPRGVTSTPTTYWTHTDSNGSTMTNTTQPPPSPPYGPSSSDCGRARVSTTPQTPSMNTPPSVPKSTQPLPTNGNDDHYHSPATPQTVTGSHLSLTPRTPPSPNLYPYTPTTPPTAKAHPLTTSTPPTASESATGTDRKRRRGEPTGGTVATQEQLYLDFGQASFGIRTVCPTCNSLYVHGVEEDEANHRRVCNEYAFGVVLAWSGRTAKSSGISGAWKNLRIVSNGTSGGNNGGLVVEVRPEDPVPYRKKVLQVKGIVDREVGFVTPSSRVGHGRGGGLEDRDERRGNENTSLQGKTAFLYVEDKRVVGFCTVEVISKAYNLLNAPEDEWDGNDGAAMTVKERTHPIPPNQASNTVTTTTPPTPTIPDDSDNGTQRHYYRSTRPTKAMMGVHQIWCHRLHRRKGIARILVDMARDKLVYGMTVPFDLVAFSSPTVDGAAFARKYSETEKPLVYDCR